MMARAFRDQPAFPFLFAAWPVMALAARNADEISGPGSLVLPVGVGVGVALLGWGCAALLTRSGIQRAAVATAVVAWWWGFRALVNAAKLIPGPGEIGWTVAFLVAVILIVRRLPDRVGAATPVLNLASALLLAVSTASLVLRDSVDLSAVLGEKAPVLEHRLDASAERPSVYLIILDGYTGSEFLRRSYGFDNRSFDDALRQRGFVLPDRFRANYTGTPLTVSALLNWDYIQAFAPELGADNIDHSLLMPYTEASRTWRFFSDAGYHILYAPAYLSMSGRNRFATTRFTDETTDFETAWKAMTPLPTARQALERLGVGMSKAIDPSGLAALHDRRFEVIEESARLEKPVFVFGHFLLPHEPYVYASDCAYLKNPLWPWHDRAIPPEVDTRAYLDQLTCVNRKVLGMVDRLLAESRAPPIILIVSDHGRSSMRFGVLPLEEASAEDVAERMASYGAFLVPEEHRKAFRKVETPVGAMRALMREVFRVPLPELPPASFWSSTRRPFGFTELDR